MADDVPPPGLPERLSGASPSWDPADWAWDSVRMVATPIATPVTKPCCATASAPRVQRQPARRPGRPSRPAPAPARKPVRENVCQADGCHKPLANLTFYHQRNRICEEHIKAPSFLKDGELLRFCQRCGVSHPLAEFDGQRKSCRKQLEKHNARRRKSGASPSAPIGTPTMPASGSDSGNCLPGSSGAPTKIMPERAWAGLDLANPSTGWGWAPGTATRPPSSSSLSQPWLAGGESCTSLSESRSDGACTGSAPDALVEELSGWLTQQLADSPVLDLPPGFGGDSDDGGGGTPAGLEALLPPTPLPAASDGFELACELMGPEDLGWGPGPVAAPGDRRAPASPPTAAAPSPGPPLLLSRISVKLFGATPEQLPPDLADQLAAWCAPPGSGLASLEAYLRPGCLHLTVQAVVQGTPRCDEEALGAVLAAMTRRVGPGADDAGGAGGADSGGLASPWLTGTALVQSGAALALLHRGEVAQRWRVRDAGRHRLVPSVHSVTPRVLLAAPVPAAGRGAVRLCVTGTNLAQTGAELLCRLQGAYLDPLAVACADCACRGSGRRAGGGGASFGDLEAACCGCCVRRLALLSAEDVESLEGGSAGEGAPGVGSRSAAALMGRSATNAEASAPLGTCCQAGPPFARRRPPHPPTQTVHLDIPAPTRPGLLHVDVQKGPYLAPPGPGSRCLVVDSPAVAAELTAWVSTAAAQGDAQCMLDALGLVYEHVGGRGKVRPGCAERAAARLAFWALRRGLAATARAALDVVVEEVEGAARALPGARAAGLDGLALLHAVHASAVAATLRRAARLGAPPGTGLGLLHAAVQSGDPACVKIVLGWGLWNSSPASSSLPGPRDGTDRHGKPSPVPLSVYHLAAAAGEESTAERLVDALLEGGLRPPAASQLPPGHRASDFAARRGHHALAGRLRALEGEAEGRQALPPLPKLHPAPDRATCCALGPGGAVPAEPVLALDSFARAGSGEPVAPDTPKRCCCKGSCPCALRTCGSCCSGGGLGCGLRSGDCPCCSG
ncbi:CRR1L1 [Auxenochlorella protothecoides x Auxenochlorella symbiontica]